MMEHTVCLLVFNSDASWIKWQQLFDVEAYVKKVEPDCTSIVIFADQHTVFSDTIEKNHTVMRTHRDSITELNEFFLDFVSQFKKSAWDRIGVIIDADHPRQADVERHITDLEKICSVETFSFKEFFVAA